MALQTILDQIRIIDPYQQRVFEHGDPPTEDSRLYLSRASNLLTKILGDDVVLQGMGVTAVIEPGGKHITATVDEGIAIADSTIIEIPEGSSTSVTFRNANNYDPTAGVNFFCLFLNYQYLETLESNPALLKLVFYDSVSRTIYPVSESLEEDEDRILLAVIAFTKSGGFVNTITVHDTYFTVPDQCDDRSVELDLWTLPTPQVYYLGGWGPKTAGMSHGGMNLAPFFRAQCEVGGHNGQGNLLVKSPNDKRWIITVDNSGNLSTVQDMTQTITCP